MSMNDALRRRRLVSLTLAALFAALTAAGTFITIPLYPVPVVLQNFFVLLSGMVLGPVSGGAAAGLYLLAGALGAPVFAGASGGLAHFFGPTGGFLAGYFLSAVTAGCIAGRPCAGVRTPLWRIVLAAFAGMLIVYVPGLFRLGMVLRPEALGAIASAFLAGDSLPFIPGFVRRALGGMDTLWLGTLAAGFFPFVIGDLIKVIAAIFAAPRLRRAAASRLDS
jgi:biotin transport system substrate-specific component